MEPLVSVCVLSKRPPGKLIREIKQQTYRNFEIIIADKPGIVNAMNRAILKAKGKIFVRIDDDVELPPCWLKELVRPFMDPKVGGTTGPTFVPYALTGNRDSLKVARDPNWFFRWMFDNDPYAPAKIYKCGSVSYGSNFMDKMQKWYYDIDHLEGTNWAMRTDLIRKVGCFDPAFDGVCEWFDTDVEFKIKALGYKLVYRRKAYLWHMVKRDTKQYSERFQGWSRIRNFIRFHRRHSKFHPKMIIWISLMGGYFAWQKFQSLFPRSKAGKNS
jgi:GT2 family glycosyltransferase